MHPINGIQQADIEVIKITESNTHADKTHELANDQSRKSLFGGHVESTKGLQSKFSLSALVDMAEADLEAEKVRR